MKYIKYARHVADALEGLSAEDLLKLLENYLLDSGFHDQYFDFSEAGQLHAAFAHFLEFAIVLLLRHSSFASTFAAKTGLIRLRTSMRDYGSQIVRLVKRRPPRRRRTTALRIRPRTRAGR